MEVYEKFINIVEKKYGKVTIFSREIGISKQLFFYHLNNLKEKKVTFNTEQIKQICKKLDIDVNFFYN